MLIDEYFFLSLIFLCADIFSLAAGVLSRQRVGLDKDVSAI